MTMLKSISDIISEFMLNPRLRKVSWLHWQKSIAGGGGCRTVPRIAQ
ncbi:MAG: hypothetical protein AB8B68_06155 [Rickettsiaceae bacterium]